MKVISITKRQNPNQRGTEYNNRDSIINLLKTRSDAAFETMSDVRNLKPKANKEHG